MKNKIDFVDILETKPSEYYKLKQAFYQANERMMNKMKYWIRECHIAGIFEYNCDRIFFFWDGLKWFAEEKNHVSIEKQICATISHEVLHKVLYVEQDYDSCDKFDNIAESLKDYGVY